MKFKLMCSKEKEGFLTEKLKGAGFEVSDDADFIISENQINIETKEFLMGRFEEKYEVLTFDTICYIEAFGKEVTAHVKQKTYILKEKLYILESMLYEKGFIRVNKSQIINIKHIEEINPWFGQKYIVKMNDDVYIDVNRTYYKYFREYFGI